jgi:D-3-phosphoglycerate dehydrogenase / 2-oxoglutarate reductase
MPAAHCHSGRYHHPVRIVFPDGAGCVQSPAELEPLRRLGTVDFHDGPPRDRAELIARVRDADAVVLDYSEMDAEILRACPRLRFISFLGIGYASCIDVDAATRQGITVANTPDYGSTSVAEHALAMMLALTRHVAAGDRSLREGRWEPGRFHGVELRGKTLGVVGLGPIGLEMARLGAGIGMRVIAWTRRAGPGRAPAGVEMAALETLFERADVVSLHLAYSRDTEGLISRALLSRMQRGAWFVNTARARIVDNVALVELLESGRIRGAALDVHETEPTPVPHPMAGVPNVLLTPHIGYNTTEASANMLRISIATLEAFARGERLHVVN